jgi:PHD/YefM family antitoxin component YafN of YafNO toxin-antitoxin module
MACGEFGDFQMTSFRLGFEERNERGVTMKAITVSELQNDAMSCLKLAKTDDLVITADGKPVGVVLRRFADEEGAFAVELENNPAFIESVQRSREQFKNGQAHRLEDVWDEIANAPEPK